jgi:predicted enzyme related to lactoylglutathione lyase
MTSRFTSLVVDAHDPQRLAEFWAAVLGWTVSPPDDDEDVEIVGPGPGPTLLFQKVPEAKTVKNRLHLDVNAIDGTDQAAEVERVVALGAKPVDIGQRDVSWVVLADPEGNEFCILRSTVHPEPGAAR